MFIRMLELASWMIIRLLRFIWLHHHRYHARITSAWSADCFWLLKNHLHLVSWMVKLTGTLVHTTCADLGSVRRSKADIPGPSVRGAQISVRRDFCVNTLFGTPGGTRRVVVKLISMDQITILTLKADHICRLHGIQMNLMPIIIIK